MNVAEVIQFLTKLNFKLTYDNNTFSRILSLRTKQFYCTYDPREDEFYVEFIKEKISPGRIHTKCSDYKNGSDIVKMFSGMNLYYFKKIEREMKWKLIKESSSH